MGSITLKFDDETFFKIKEHKADLERDMQMNITWESYFRHLDEDYNNGK